MHRLRSPLSARLPGRLRAPATALERRGVIATYELHDRALANRTSRRRQAAAASILDETQRALLDELRREGWAMIAVTDLVGDERWHELDRLGRRFVEDTERGLETGEGLRRRAGKEFVVRAHSFDGVALGSDDPWLATCLSPRLLDLANTYLGMWSKLSYVDLWYTAPQAREAERAASQLWHLDFDDKHLLKAFLYLSDVDEGAGPFEYVPGSQPGGRYEDVWRWAPLGVRRIPEEEVAAHVAASEIRTFTAPRGTLILCNTSGLHRGGFATASPRVLATATYCSPASLKSLSMRSYAYAGPLDELSSAARYAVS